MPAAASTVQQPAGPAAELAAAARVELPPTTAAPLVGDAAAETPTDPETEGDNGESRGGLGGMPAALARALANYNVARLRAAQIERRYGLVKKHVA